ncbi:MAG: hypothetical protein KME42_00345 [Tildeniella nuda ZEHNDER 1965/U140]|nr:hypothetical protein [Tildeniella nuda ZEHNDER 1965/U140]
MNRCGRASTAHFYFHALTTIALPFSTIAHPSVTKSFKSIKRSDGADKTNDRAVADAAETIGCDRLVVRSGCWQNTDRTLANVAEMTTPVDNGEM